jgi:hypothetical protein
MTFNVKLTNFWLQILARLLSSPCAGVSSKGVVKKTNPFRVIASRLRKRAQAASSAVRAAFTRWESGFLPG